MVFSTTNLFKGIQCPEGEKCALTNCIFAHDLRPQTSEPSPELVSTSNSKTVEAQSCASPREPPAKRRRVAYDTLSQKPPSKAEQIRAELAASRKVPGCSDLEPGEIASDPESSTSKPPPSLVRTVSPPATNGKHTSRSLYPGANNTRADNSNHNNVNTSISSSNYSKLDSKSTETLNPRLVPYDPAGHAKRSLYLRYIHGEMMRLNKQVSERQTQGLDSKDVVVLTEQDLIKLTLDEEEKVAKDQPLVYANLIKQRMALYKKMTAEEWIVHLKTRLETDYPKASAEAIKPLDTGLGPDQELVILPHLVINQTGLEKHGYIPIPPTTVEAAEAGLAVEVSKNYEVCDRCSARFQVFPERSEDGLLTSNGPCKYHPNRKVFPQKSKGEIVSGLPKDPYYPCCSGALGSPGCTEHEYHVFKSSNPARLAAVLPFITTPENEEPAVDKHGKEVKAVSFDCEMGYTVYGLELIRLTAVSWPPGEELLDVLVRPVGIMIDFNSKFSGVWPEHFTDAIPYDEWRSSQYQEPDFSATKGTAHSPAPAPLPIVDSPERARQLLCSFLSPTTPLIGHAIDNDLNAVRLCHPSIVDTVILFPHPRGLPLRFGLKMLTSKHLNRAIQTGGARGHDSLEDARATGDLVRYKIGEKWKALRSTGWQIVNGQLIVPLPPGRDQLVGPQEDDKAYVKAMLAKAFECTNAKLAGKKRKKKAGGGGPDDSTEDEAVLLGKGVAAYLQRARGTNGVAEHGA